jgi:hypothetical protein
MSGTTIRQALVHVTHYPNPIDDNFIEAPVWELIARQLFTIANSPSQSKPRANKARKQIMDRMDGKRRTGTRPVVHDGRSLEFIDLTGGEISAPASATGSDV